jgi:hypothetical protein
MGEFNFISYRSVITLNMHEAKFYKISFNGISRKQKVMPHTKVRVSARYTIAFRTFLLRIFNKL